MSQFHSLKIIKLRQLTDDSVEIIFEIPSNLSSEFTFMPGQYITISHEINNEEIRRAYSICSDVKLDNISIGVKRVKGGKMSNFLTKEVKEGDFLDVMSPNGSFRLKNEKNIVGICAGSGITPILSMIKSSPSNFLLVYGNKTQDSSMFLSDLDKMDINSHYLYSREDISGCFNSRIDENILLEISKESSFFNADGYFICGPGLMIDVVEQFLLSHGIDKSIIHFERFSSVEKEDVSEDIKKVDIISNVTVIVDGDEFEYELSSNGENILDSAISQGADVPFSCKGGVCCTCKAKVIEGKAFMTENYALSEEEVDEGFILTCKSHPHSNDIVVDFDEI